MIQPQPAKALEQEIIQSHSHIDSDLLERLITTVFSPHKCAPVSNGTLLIVQIVRLTSVGNARSKTGVLNWISCLFSYLLSHSPSLGLYENLTFWTFTASGPALFSTQGSL